RAKPGAPELVTHQRQSTASQSMKPALGVQKISPAGGRSGKLDGRFHAFAAGAGKENPAQLAAGQLAQPLGEYPGQFRNMALQHRGAGAIQLPLQSFDNTWMIMSGVVDAVARQKIQIPMAVFCEELCSRASLVADVQFEQVQQPDPLRINVLGIFRTCRDDSP